MADATLPNPMPNRTIEDHGAIGNLDTIALVARDGAIDFLCWPHLDSPTIFAALLDPERGGAFEIAPRLDRARTLQMYLPDTKVLMTRWLAESGSAELLDFMPYPEGTDEPRGLIVRRIRATRGTVEVDIRCRPRFDYARMTPETSRVEGGVRFHGSGVDLRLSSDAPLDCRSGEAFARVRLEEGEEAWFTLCDHDQPAPTGDEITELADATTRAWRRWADNCAYHGRWREEVVRSALTLKLLTSCRHGSIAAAATFGLPEATGAERNWDYRATWIRDASFTVYAFMRLGQVEEAEQFRRWLGQRTGHKGHGDQLQTMYALDGSPVPDETHLDHLAGYGGARPIRIGNEAHHQLQLDIFGEAMDSIYLSNKYGTAMPHEGWAYVHKLVDFVRKNWRKADAGIWEIRDEPRVFLHSHLMCWVALDRACRLAVKRSLPAPLERWRRERDRIAEEIWANFRHPEHGYFVQSRGSRDVDASLLMMPLMRFVSATDPVWLATLDAIRDELAEDGMIFRYRNADGLEGGEGAFTACAFWYVECLARAGRLDEARLAMENALRTANHLGLFSEELDRRGCSLGNFPQGLTHLAFISAAYFLNRRLDPPNNNRLWQP